MNAHFDKAKQTAQIEAAAAQAANADFDNRHAAWHRLVAGGKFDEAQLGVARKAYAKQIVLRKSQAVK